MNKFFFGHIFDRLIYFFGRISGFFKESRPLLHWKMMFLLFIFLFAAVLALDVYFFWNLNKIGLNEEIPADSNSIDRTTRNKLENITRELDAKKEKFDYLMNKKPDINDPSL